jgi:hypothetical protein
MDVSVQSQLLHGRHSCISSSSLELGTSPNPQCLLALLLVLALLLLCLQYHQLHGMTSKVSSQAVDLGLL